MRPERARRTSDITTEQARTAPAHPERHLHAVMALETLALALIGKGRPEAGLAVWGAHGAAVEDVGYAGPASHWQAGAPAGSAPS